MEPKKETSSINRSSIGIIVIRIAGAKIIIVDMVFSATTMTEHEHVQLCEVFTVGHQFS